MWSVTPPESLRYKFQEIRSSEGRTAASLAADEALGRTREDTGGGKLRCLAMIVDRRTRTMNSSKVLEFLTAISAVSESSIATGPRTQPVDGVGRSRYYPDFIRAIPRERP